VRLSGPWEHGTPGTDKDGSSKRIDLIKFREAVRAGKRKRDLLEDAEFIQVLSKYPKFVDTCYELFPTERDGAPEVTILYGPPGCGKTRRVIEGSEDLWKAPLGKGGWFNRYDGHPDVLMDDFSGKVSHTQLSDLLRLLDRYAESVPTKGSFVGWKPKRVFITTNIHPWDWYDWKGREVHYPALRRRITRVIAWGTSEYPDRQAEVLDPIHPLWERFWETYSIDGLSARNERTWDPNTRAFIIRSQPGDWRDKFDYLWR